MILRRRHALLLLLAVMWAFGTYHSGRTALTHFQDRATAVDLVEPAQPVIAALQEERRLTALVLAGPGRPDELAAQRARTDQAAARLRESAGRARVGWSGTPAGGAAARLLDRLAALAAIRTGVDDRSLDARQAAAAYTETTGAALQLAAAIWPRTDPAAAERQRALAALTRAGELLAREDALISGARATFTDADRTELAQLAGARRLLHADAAAALAAPDRARLDALPDTGLAAAEDALVRGTGAPDAAAWRAAAGPALAAERGIVAAGLGEGTAGLAPAGVSAIVQVGLFGGLGLVAVLAAYALARRRDAPAAEPDDGTATVLLTLSRRNQALLHRQLAVLDELERRENDTGDLAALFRADHLAAQLRRNVEKAIILGGGAPGRRWRRPVPVVDVARAAAASVERYGAVMVASVDPAGLAGPAVGDVTHLLTELIDNATRCSPGDSTVWVTGELGLTAYTVVVQDRGPGMTAGELAAARDALARPFRPAGPERTGLRLAGRLARTHAVEIDLEEAPRGGIAARVRIPLGLMVLDDDPHPDPPRRPEPPDPGVPPGLPEPRQDGLPQRAPGPVPVAAGFAWRRADRPPPVDRTARFRDRLAARGRGGPGADPGGDDTGGTSAGDGRPDVAAPTVELPMRHSTVDDTAQR
ncbi:nitrate- and nitrite sensing domain-containing protein [Dactylosporangium roseum]|uniref:histidine kinase n=1 Tax=Dactylosporangium roseum TaxID=47989 RepID=A0ABY5Z9V6_9ACTN|nr:nitrate- and nitrite sensing domain-containing protein [Dactylosporangium roseum]UWZ38873.1 nitrate- and nitrite sensing domain-containing protein [Dactylosporangium roseum]